MEALSVLQPYPGLRPFDEGDQPFFFGRDAQIKSLRQKLLTNRLVAVVGRSGCGKSSLVRAGLIPLLKRAPDSDEHTWKVATFRPQGRPIHELGRTLLELTPGVTPSTWELRRMRLDAMLRRSGLGLLEAVSELNLPASGRLLIVIDQFEEIFRFEDPAGSNTDEATAFVRLLTEAINADGPLHLMLTMRLDFLGDCARFPRLPEAINNGQFLVPNLSRAERRAAIEKPAEKAKKTIKPEVTQKLLNDIGDDPDQLPVLQHVLMRTWQQAGGHDTITLKNYDDTGGVPSAIERHADQIFEKLDEKHKKVAERLFKALSERDQRGRSVRRGATFAAVEKILQEDDPRASDIPEQLTYVIEKFRAPDACFLLPPADEKLVPEDRIDISHESLLRGWKRLGGTTGIDGWIAEEARDGRIYAGLLEVAQSGSTLPPRIAQQRQQWWRAARPNEAWALRYGNEFSKVADFVAKGWRRSMLWRALTVIGIALIVTLGGTIIWLRFNEVVKDLANNILITQYRSDIAGLQAEKARLDRDNAELKDVVQRLQSSLPQSDQKARQDLANLLPDASLQRPNVDQRTLSAQLALQGATGFMWIGSAQNSNLSSPNGDPVSPASVAVGDQYLTTLDIFLREGAPDPTNYSQKRTLGILPEGTRVQVVSILPPFSRPSGEQYWTQVRVTKLALSTIYFQFAGGSRDQAQQLSKALQDLGYKIPGEERTSLAAGKHEVRYFYPGQRDAAAQLASDTSEALKKLGYSTPPIGVTAAGNVTKNNADGKLELWIEIPPR